MISFRLRRKWQNCRGYVSYYERTPKNRWFDIHSVFATHVETVVLLSQQKPNDKIEVDLDLDELDVTSAELKATYAEIKDYVLKEHGLKVSNLYISQVKRKCGLEVGENYNLRKATRRMDCLQDDSTTAANLEKLVSQGMAKSEDAKQPNCPDEKEKAIREALKYFGMI